MSGVTAVPGVQNFKELREMPLDVQINYASVIRTLEYRQLEPFIPTRSSEAILADALLTMRMTELEGRVGLKMPTPRTDAFVKRQAALG